MLIPFINRLLHWFSVGIGSTVLMLLIISKGSSVSSAGLVVAFYSVSVILFEFPSGVLSDMVGQKKMYLFSLVLSLAAYAIVLFSGSMPILILGFSVSGIARAFSSGSVEALFYNEYIQKNGKESLHRLAGVLNAGEITGLAIGALCGGFIPVLWFRLFPGQNRYNGDLAVQILVQLILFVFTLLCVRDAAEAVREKPRLLPHICESFAVIANSRTLALLLGGSLVWGLCFNSIELYWQPRLKEILGSDARTGIFGSIHSGYFFASLAGVGLVGLLLKRFSIPSFTAIFATRLATGFLIVVFAFQSALLPFAAVYLLLFMFNGMASIPETTALNRHIPDDKRSSILSLSSLVVQVGGVLGALLFSLLLTFTTISVVWLIAGLLFAGSGFLFLRKGKDHA